MDHQKKGFASLLLVTIIVVAIFGVFVAGGIYVLRLKKPVSTAPAQTISEIPEASAQTDTTQLAIPEVSPVAVVVASTVPVAPVRPKGPANATLERVMTPGTPCDPKNPTSYANSTCSMDFYFKDTQTAQVTPFMTIDQVNWNNPDPVQYAGGYAFVLRRMGDDSSATAWTDELWMYDASKQGLRVAAGQGLTFKVNPDASMIAVDIDTPVNQLQVLDGNTFQPVVVYNIADIGQTSQSTNPAVIPNQPWDLTLNAWNSAGNTLWASLGQQASTTTLAFVKFQPQQKGINVYTNKSAGQILSTNFNTGMYVTTDRPFFFDAQSDKNWVAKKQTYSVFVAAIDGSERNTLGSFPSSWPLANFKFGWDAQGNVTYTSPTGQQTYTLQ